MTIAIVTQPLLSNYGGLLQNWALQQVLRREYPGSEVVTFDQVDSLAPFYLRIGHAIKKKLGLSHDVLTSFDVFRATHIRSTARAKSMRALRYLDRKWKPDRYIVGSDQVWRPRMCYNLGANFLGFTDCPYKIAYAASFGVDSWEYTAAETQLCKSLATRFSAVSVREDSGVELCKTHLGVDAVHVLDPTLLLHNDDYNVLTHAGNFGSGHLFTYILNTSLDKQTVVSGLLDTAMEVNAAYDVNGNMRVNRLSVEEWLIGIRDARLVVCDSFHGVAFSIIYNKDFIALANPERGNSRLTSLLTMFGLQDRLVTCIDEAKRLKPIDWGAVNAIREDLISKSITFLRNSV